MLAYIVARYDSYVNIFKKKDVMSKINSWRLRKTVNGLDPAKRRCHGVSRNSYNYPDTYQKITSVTK